MSVCVDAFFVESLCEILYSVENGALTVCILCFCALLHPLYRKHPRGKLSMMPGRCSRLLLTIGMNGNPNIERCAGEKMYVNMLTTDYSQMF
jgi:hypothetical protein